MRKNEQNLQPVDPVADGASRHLTEIRVREARKKARKAARANPKFERQIAMAMVAAILVTGGGGAWALSAALPDEDASTGIAFESVAPYVEEEKPVPRYIEKELAREKEKEQEDSATIGESNSYEVAEAYLMSVEEFDGTINTHTTSPDLSEIRSSSVTIEEVDEMELALRLADEEQARYEAEQEAIKRAESDLNRTIQVVLGAQSVEKDLRIQFTDSATGKLIEGVPLSASVKQPDGMSIVCDDEDRDGMIHLSDLAAGDYTVTQAQITDKSFARYRADLNVRKVAVRNEIAYEMVDVASLIKHEDEIDVAREDTGMGLREKDENDTPLEDTVKFLASSKKEVSAGKGEREDIVEYKKIDREDIVEPFLSARLERLSNAFVLFSAADTISVEVNEAASFVSVPVIEHHETESAKTGESKAASQVSTAPASPASASSVAGSTLPAQTDSASAGSVSSQEEVVDVTSQVPEETVQVESTADTSSEETVDVGTSSSGGASSSADSSSQVTVSSSSSAASASEDVIDVTNPGTSRSGSSAGEGGSSDGSSSQGVSGRRDASSGGRSAVREDEELLDVETLIEEQEEELEEEEEIREIDPEAKLKDTNGNQVYIRNSVGHYVAATGKDLEKADTFYIRLSQVKYYKYAGWQTIQGTTYYYDENGERVTGKQVIQGVAYEFRADGSLSTGGGIIGVDVSRYNGDIDWRQLRNAGISFAIIRCGYRGSSGGNLIEDTLYRQNMAGATAAGIRVGVYFVTQAVNQAEAVEEASMVLNLISGYHLSMPVFLDVESSGGRGDAIDAGTRTAVIKAFCETMSNAGYRSGVYASRDWLNNRFDSSQLTDYSIWLAHYTGATNYSKTKYDMWQYSSAGRLPGVNDRIDMNICYTNY